MKKSSWPRPRGACRLSIRRAPRPCLPCCRGGVGQLGVTDHVARGGSQGAEWRRTSSGSVPRTLRAPGRERIPSEMVSATITMPACLRVRVSDEHYGSGGFWKGLKYHHAMALFCARFSTPLVNGSCFPLQPAILPSLAFETAKDSVSLLTLASVVSE